MDCPRIRSLGLINSCSLPSLNSPWSCAQVTTNGRMCSNLTTGKSYLIMKWAKFKSNHYLVYGAKVHFSSFESILPLPCLLITFPFNKTAPWVCILSQPQYYCFCSCTFDLRSFMSIGEKTFQRTGFTSSKNGQSYKGLRFRRKGCAYSSWKWQ